eukprot:comp20230_c0_seq2/m.40100 comp20230_c0_seq2/g.40100  ORF comp20230_c0_seq2/g.40100 comp20230_c0_seq2/m.40100 type:complete len:218 (-) comp20230_c0_seq2:142-795(-)
MGNCEKVIVLSMWSASALTLIFGSIWQKALAASILFGPISLFPELLREFVEAVRLPNVSLDQMIDVVKEPKVIVGAWIVSWVVSDRVAVVAAVVARAVAVGLRESGRCGGTVRKERKFMCAQQINAEQHHQQHPVVPAEPAESAESVQPEPIEQIEQPEPIEPRSYHEQEVELEPEVDREVLHNNTDSDHHNHHHLTSSLSNKDFEEYEFVERVDAE